MAIDLKVLVRDFRKSQTDSEKLLWTTLRNRQFLGLKFVRQYPITFQIGKTSKFFVADFYCSRLKLAIELDGEIHNNQKERDQERDIIINSKGIEIVRIKNREIKKDIKTTLEKLELIVQQLSTNIHPPKSNTHPLPNLPVRAKLRIPLSINREGEASP